MLNIDNLKNNFDSDLIEISPLVIRNVPDKNDAGETTKEPVAQFQVKNISKKSLSDLTVEINYYDRDVFCGMDDDFRLEPLKPNEIHTFSIYIEPPKSTDNVELKIAAKQSTFMEQFPHWVQLLIYSIMFLSVFVFVKYFK